MPYNVYQNDELIAEEIEGKEYTVEGLTPNTEYSFSVSEVIGDEESERSEPIVVTTEYSDVESVTVSPKNNNLKIGATRNLNVTIEPDTANKDVDWSSDDDEIATVDADGTVTAIGTGTTTVTVTADGVSDTATINVTEPEPEEGIEPESVEITPAENNLSETGVIRQLTAIVLPEEADQTVIWSTEDENIARVDENGLLRSIGVGETTITATAVNGVEGTATVSVAGEG